MKKIKSIIKKTDPLNVVLFAALILYTTLIITNVLKIIN